MHFLQNNPSFKAHTQLVHVHAWADVKKSWYGTLLVKRTWCVCVRAHAGACVSDRRPKHSVGGKERNKYMYIDIQTPFIQQAFLKT